MAMRGNRGGGGDRVLESRHVIGLFLLMLVFSGVFFALGYVMGRNQYDGQVRAESTPRATPDPVSARADVPSRRSKNSQASATANSVSTANSSSATNSSSSGNSGWGSVSSSPSAATNSRETASAPTATPDDSATPSSDWNFYNSSKNPPDDRLKPVAPGDPATSTMSPSNAAGKTPKPSPVSNKATATASASAPVTAGSPFPPGTYVLQVAAMRQSVDASAVATSLRAKHFPAIVVNPTTDKYYHVQVGPYHDVKSADVAKKGLESAGFKAIVKH
jgi:cell division septation protein DedD